MLHCHDGVAPFMGVGQGKGIIRERARVMPTLNFKGKAFVANHHMAVPYHTLKPVKSKGLSKEPKLEDNLIVHGDNLKALKALLPTYAGRVKCIYIDPPYNTGNEKWAYNDNVNSPMMKEWLGKVVDTEDLTRHDKWLCMMTPRLKLLREFLRDDGVIFISIDDNEVHHLRMLMDEIFGEGNFVANVVWQKRTSPDIRATIGAGHDHIIVFAKTVEKLKNIIKPVPKSEEQISQYKNPDNDPRGPWVSSDFTAQGYRPNQMYKITTPGGAEHAPPAGTCWKNIESVYKELVADNRIWFGKNKMGVPRKKTFLSESEGHIVWTWWTNAEVGHTQEAKKEINIILGDEAFDTPKPIKLLKRILGISTSVDDIILDSFAGSGTTAHAVLALNKEDGGARRFILVECEDYADSVTAERVRRVIKGVPNAKKQELRDGLGGSFSFFELGAPIEIEKMLSGENLPSYTELARYVFYTATGQEFDEKKVNEKKHFIGETKEHEVYLFYKPDVEYLKATALTLDHAKGFGPFRGKRRLVFAPTKYLDQDYLAEYRIDFAQLPYQIYRRVK